MADEPTDLVLRLLRDIRGDMSEVKSVLSDHSMRFDRLERSMNDIQDSVTTALGLSAMANVRHDGVAREIEALMRNARRIDDLEARVARLEERPV